MFCFVIAYLIYNIVYMDNFSKRVVLIVLKYKMDNAFKQVCKFCAVYMDDVLVYSQTEDDHMRHLDKVTDVFR